MSWVYNAFFVDNKGGTDGAHGLLAVHGLLTPLTYLTFFKEVRIVDLNYYYVVDGIFTVAYPILMILPSPNHSTAFSNTC